MRKPKILSSKQVHNGWLKLGTDTLKVPELKKPYDYDVVKIGNGVATLPFLESEETVLLAKQYRHPIQESLLELIQGGIGRNETPEQASNRELLEETGYTGEVEVIKKIHLMPGSLDNTLYICRAHNLKKISKPKPNPLEALELLEYDFPTLLDEILSGKHEDSALNIAVLYHALNPLSKY